MRSLEGDGLGSEGAGSTDPQAINADRRRTVAVRCPADLTFRPTRLTWTALRVALLTTILLGFAACSPTLRIGCSEIGKADCTTVVAAARESLSADVRDRVVRATVRPTTVDVCVSEPGCDPIADVDFEVAGLARVVTVTVSRLPDGRLVAETY